nr:MAG TPA: small integral membrane protein [Caudoviricetes sp.]
MCEFWTWFNQANFGSVIGAALTLAVAIVIVGFGVGWAIDLVLCGIKDGRK